MRISFALKSPRRVTVRSAVVARIDAAYSSGSVKAWTALDGILSPSLSSECTDT